MPAVDTTGNRTIQPKKKLKKSVKAKVRASQPVPSGDQVDRNRAARAEQLARSKSLSPDRQDEKRSPAQRKRDEAAVARNVKASRVKVLTEDRKGFDLTDAVSRELAGKGVLKSVADKLGNRAVKNIRTSTSPGGARDLSGVGGTGASRLVERAVKDFVDLPAVAVPSVSQPVIGAVEALKSGGKDTKRLRGIAKSVNESDPVYNLGAALVEAAGGDSKSAKMRLKRAKDSANEHPGFAVAEVGGVRGVAGRGAGSVARTGALGKTVKAAGSTARAPKVLPGTNLTVHREWSRDISRKAVQTLSEKTPTKDRMVAKTTNRDLMTTADIQRRVDERYGVTGADRVPFVKEFGHTVNGKLRVFQSPKQAARRATELEQRSGQPFAAVERGGQIALVPKVALDRLAEHARTKTGTTLTKSMEVANDTFRRTVLSTSTSWALGNLAEGALRAAVNRSGPRSWETGRRVVAKVKALDPAKAEELGARILDGGHYSLAEKLQVQNVAEKFTGTKLEPMAEAMSKVLKTPGPKQLTQLWKAWTESVFHGTRKLEQQFQIAHLGAEVRRSHLMDGNLLKLGEKAMDEAARGLTNTETQVRFARAVQTAYGKYAAFSPSTRMLMASYSPFIAWFANAVQFVGHTLPMEHPAVVGLTAAAANATEEWRKEHGLDLWMQGSVPGFLQGSLPSGGGFKRLSRFTPFGAFGDLPDTLASQVLPLYSGPVMALKGLTWNGSRIRSDSGTTGDTQAKAALTALGEFLDATIPVVAQAKRVGTKGAKAFNPLATTSPKKANSAPTSIDNSSGFDNSTGFNGGFSDTGTGF